LWPPCNSRLFEEEAPVRYVIRQQWFSWGDDFDIFDAAGNKAYFVDGHGIAIRNKLSFQDTARKELAFIEQARLGGGTEYTLSRGGKQAARVSKQSLAGEMCRFYVDVPGSDDPIARGDFYNHNYRLERSSRTAATISRPNSADSGYVVDVANGEDPVLMLAAVIVIDLISHEGAGEGKVYK